MCLKTIWLSLETEPEIIVARYVPALKKIWQHGVKFQVSCSCSSIWTCHMHTRNFLFIYFFKFTLGRTLHALAENWSRTQLKMKRRLFVSGFLWLKLPGRSSACSTEMQENFFTFFVSLADNFCFLDSAALKMVFCIPRAFLSLQKENVAMPSFCFFCWRGGWKDRPTRQEIVRKGWELRDT